MIERRATHSTAAIDPETTGFEKKQYEILLGQYVHWIFSLSIGSFNNPKIEMYKERESERERAGAKTDYWFNH